MNIQKYTAERILMDLGKNIREFKEKIIKKDGTIFKFRLELSTCKTEKEVFNLIQEYI